MPGSSRSPAIVSIPDFVSSEGRALFVNRATAITRFFTPARSAARRANRARLGPILPPAPRINRSPSSAAIAEAVSSSGSESNSSRSVSVLIFTTLRSPSSYFEANLRSVAAPLRHQRSLDATAFPTRTTGTGREGVALQRLSVRATVSHLLPSKRASSHHPRVGGL